jgi:hypothetical protein
MHYNFFSAKGQQIMAEWIGSEDGCQFWSGQPAAQQKLGISAILC